MNRILWKSLIATPALIGASLSAATDVRANEDFKAQESFNSETQEVILAQSVADENADVLNQLDAYSAEGAGATPQEQGQVTSVSQLRDVSPTDWAYEALRSLVERYGCIVGYPDRTFRGNRATSRYEFAAGLNACMQQMERLIAQSEAVLREDIEKLKRLMQEFEAELAALGARVDNLEGRVAFLEDHQFSTTTKLQGEVIFAATQAFLNDDGNGADNQAILADRVRLVLNTSFTGEDKLITRLAAGNANTFRSEYDSTFRTPGFPVTEASGVAESATLNQTFNLGNTGDNDVIVDWLAYYAPPIKLSEDSQISTYLAAFGGLHVDYAPTANPYFEDYDGGNGALSEFAQSNPIYRIGGNAGVGFNYEAGWLNGLLGPTTVSVGYFAGGEANSPRNGDGLFNGDYSVLGQVHFNISDSVALGFTYIHGFHKEDSPIFGYGASGGVGVVGTQLANLNRTSLQGILTDDFPVAGLELDFGDKVSNSYGTQFAWRISDSISFSAFFTYTNAVLLGRGSNDIWTYGGGFAFPDLGKEGNVLGIFAGVQPYNADSRFFLTDTVTGESYRTRISNNQVPVHVEAFYKYQINDNISLTPGLIWISAPNQGRNSGDQLIGTLRTTFTF